MSRSYFYSCVIPTDLCYSSGHLHPKKRVGYKLNASRQTGRRSFAIESAQADTSGFEKKPKLRLHVVVGILCLAAIAIHLPLRFTGSGLIAEIPLLIALGLGGLPLIWGLTRELLKGRFGADILGGIAICTAVALHEYLAGTIVVLMLAGGVVLESYAVVSASSVLHALAKRVPSVAHAMRDNRIVDIPLDTIEPGDVLSIMPHEICPADGVIADGHGWMDESYLTGEPYQIAKAPGSEVLSGATNGDAALTVRVSRKPEDSRYARIMRVMRESEQQRPQLRRIGDSLGALYTPVALAIAVFSAVAAHDPTRFLAVLVVATPCPLLIAIPVAIIGSISLAAKRGIIIKDPGALEQLSKCRTLFFDKTGTLTYGEPHLSEIMPAIGESEARLLSLAGSLSQYSRHPLSKALMLAAETQKAQIVAIDDLTELPGQGLTASINGKRVQLTGRKKLSEANRALLPPVAAGLESVLLIDGNYAGTFRFRDDPRPDAKSFIKHLGPRHAVQQMILLTGDRASEAQHLAQTVGIDVVVAEKSPEEKLEIVKAETLRHKTAYVGDGINDAPALLAANVGIAFGKASDVTTEAASAVILSPSLRKVDELWHISARLRRIALQSAVGGMGLSLIAVMFAAFGYLPPVAGAVAQEVIDVLAVLNALRAAVPPRSISDL